MDRIDYQHASVPPVVLDATILIDDVLQGLRNGRTTALRRVMAIANVQAVTTVVDETRRHLRNRAIEAELDPDVAMDVLVNSYLPLLQTSKADAEASDDPRVSLVAARDHDDVGTAQLVVSLAPAVCLTRDRDLLDYGLGTAEWLDLIRAIEDLAEFRALLEATVLLVDLVRICLTRALTVQPWLLAILAATISVIAMRLPDPVATLQRTHRLLATVVRFYLELASRGVIAEAYVKSRLILPIDEATQQDGQT